MREKIIRLNKVEVDILTVVVKSAGYKEITINRFVYTEEASQLKERISQRKVVETLKLLVIKSSI